MSRFIVGLAGSLLLFVAVFTRPAEVQASCLPLDLAAVPRTAETAIFAGTVTDVQADHVFMRIEAWFVGADPVETAEIVGGRGSNDPGVVTSVDWTPAPGEQYLVVAERKAPTGFVTKPCQQIGVDGDLMERATAILGSPHPPPFETLAPAATPSARPPSGPAGTNDDLGSPTGGGIDTPLWVVLLVALAIAGSLALLTQRRWRDRRRG